MQKAKINPKVLRWAVDNNHYSISEFSKKMNRPVDLIIKWTKGEDYPTYIQLEKISYDILKLPIAVFFFPEPPVERITKEFRTLPNILINQLSPYFIRLLRKSKSLQLKVIELCDGKNPSSDFILDNFSFDNMQNIQEVCSKLRSFLEISIEEQFSWRNIDIALKGWRNCIESKGIFIFKDAFGDNNISGFSLYDEHFPIIIINNSLSKSRQIFTIFHELAHIFFQTAGIDSIDDSYIYDLSKENKNIEIYCNKFTSEFLVPSNNFYSSTRDTSVTEKNITEIAEKYSVSREVILRKYYDLDEINQDEYNYFSNKWNKEAAKYSKKRGMGGNYYLNKITYLGQNYLDLAFRKYYTNEISKYKLSEYLDIKVNNISSLEGVYQR